MDHQQKHVEEQIEQNNHWYTSSQFKWAEAPFSKRIYAKRNAFFKKVIDGEIAKKGKVSLLDYGCGDGYWSSMLSKIEHCSVTGIDYNPLRIERARSVVPKATFHQSDVTDTGNNFGTFDIVLCSQIIEHVRDDEDFLRNIKRFMADDSRLILGTPNEGCTTQRFRNWITPEETDHVHFYTEREIVRKLHRAGFVIHSTLREVFYPGNDRIYYKLTSFDMGFKFLELCTSLIPSQCSDYYFDCTKNA